MARIGIRTIAEEAKVSPMTVSLALRNSVKIAEETRKRIQGIAKRLGYQSDPLLSAFGTRIRSKDGTKVHSNLAFVHDWTHRDDCLRLPWLARYWNGANERAAALGCSLSPIWLRERDMSSKRLQSILHARGIRGIVLHQINYPQLLQSFDFDSFGAVSIGRTGLDKGIPMVLPDATNNALLAVENLVRKGYRRIGFFQSSFHHERTLAEGLSAAYYHSFRLTGTQPLVPFLFSADEDPDQHFAAFNRWLRTEQPDVVLTENDDIIIFLKASDCRMPRDLSVVHLEITDTRRSWSGIDPLPEALGAAAIDILVAQLFRNELGTRLPTSSSRIIGRWIEGGTCPDKITADPSALVAQP